MYPLPYVLRVALALSLETHHRPSQAGASLVWGHEKTEFEDDQGWQWRAWFNECGKAFKMKGAWGHPDIVSIFPVVVEIARMLIYSVLAS